jgi:hypothetical protein
VWCLRDYGDANSVPSIAQAIAADLGDGESQHAARRMDADQTRLRAANLEQAKQVRRIRLVGHLRRGNVHSV